MDNIQGTPQETGGWDCACGAHNKATNRFCTHCGSPQPAPPTTQTGQQGPPDEWDCRCGFHNRRGKFCSSCGQPRPMQQESPSTAAPAPKKNPLADGLAALQAKASQTVAQGKELMGRKAPKAASPPSSAEDAPGVPWETKSPGFRLDRRTAPVIVIAVILLIAAFWGYGAYRDKLYAAKCEELLAVMAETQETAKGLEGLSAEADVSKGEIAERFADEAKRIEAMESSFSGQEARAASKEQHEHLMFLLAQDKEMLQKASETLQAAGKAENNADLETLSRLHQEFEAALKRVQDALEEAKIPGQGGQAISYQPFNDHMRAYVLKKLGRSKLYLEEKVQQYQNRLRADNEALKRKTEVVFLAEGVHKEGNDIVVRGRFYNGTDEFVVGIGDMLVDATLNQFDEAVASVSDFPYQDASLAKVMLSPKESTGLLGIRLAGKAPSEEFNNFVIRVHKIHWRIRKAVKP